MDRKALAERLRALASDDRVKRSKTASLRAVLDDVEQALAAGVPRSLVVEELAAHGLEMTPATFDTTLNRIRRKRDRLLPETGNPAGKTQGQLTGSRPPAISAEVDSVPSISHDPADLDHIIKSRPDLDALASLAKRRKK